MKKGVFLIMIVSIFESCVYHPIYEGSQCGPNDSCPPGYTCVLGEGEAAYCTAFAKDADGDSGEEEKDGGTKDGDETIADGDETIADGDETIADGDETIADGDESPSDGDETISDGDESPSDGDETVEDCSLPTPEDPLYLFFCLDTAAANLILWRWVDREEDIRWGIEPGCETTGSRRLACRLVDYGPSSVYFDIAIEDGWACENGPIPRVWLYGNELTVSKVNPEIANVNGLSNGYYIAGSHELFQTFTTGPSATEIMSVDIYIVKVGNPGDLTVSIRAVNVNGYPTGADLVSQAKPQTDVTTGWNTFIFAAPPTLLQSNQYALVVKAPSGNYPSNFYSWDRSNTSAYPGRAGETNGVTWSFLSPEIDYIFRVHQGCDFHFAIP